MLKASVQLAYFPRITKKRAKMALDFFGSAEALFAASSSELIDAGWKSDIAAEFRTWTDTFDVAAAARLLDAEGITAIAQDDEAFPPQLHDLYEVPLCLFVRGALERYTSSVAIVGTRKMTNYGRMIVDKFVPTLVRSGVTVVSGLAFGVDAASHRATLAAGGHTIAVLGSGVDERHVSPATHRRLASEIVAAGGAIISEYPPGTVATTYTFPERNRIIAALSRATLIVEAGVKSGSLITASCALDIGRDVCTVPHPIHTPLGIGPNKLIQQGAHTVLAPRDVLEIIGISEEAAETAQRSVPNTATEKRIHILLQTEAKHIDDIIATTGIAGTEVMSSLSIMEMRGLVKNMGNMMYIAV